MIVTQAQVLQRLVDQIRNDSAVAQTAVEIQQIPAPTFAEGRRAAEVRRRMEAIGLSDIDQDEVGNVYACRRGRDNRPGVLLAAHLDTVFPEGTDLLVRRDGDRIYGPGIGDNSLGVAALLHLACAFDQVAAPHGAPIWFVADVGEEGLGDLRGMRAAVDRLGDAIDAVIAIEGLGFGRIYHRAIGVRRLRVEIRATGGHSWADFGSPSALHLLIEVAAAVARLPLSREPRTTLNIGVMQGGTSVNTIAEAAHFLLDLRSEDQGALLDLLEEVRRTVAHFELPAGASLQATLVGQRDGGSISESHPLARAAAAALREAGAAAEWGSGSTDANVPLSRGIPAICIGITHGGDAHRLHEYIDTADIPRGMEALARVVWSLVE